MGKTSRLASAGALFVFILLVAGVAFAQVDRSRDLRPERDIHEMRDIRGTIPTGGAELFIAGEILVKYHGESAARRVHLAAGETVSGALTRLSREGDVEYAEPNYIAYAFMVPNDSLYDPFQWNFDNLVTGGIGMEEAWDIAQGAGVTIALIDTGVAYEDYTQPNGTRYYQASDLAGTTFVPGWDFVNNDAHPNDDQGHGTHVAGTLAGTTNNSLGVAGIAFKAGIMPLKVLNSSGSGSYSAIADAIRYAADNGAKVINMSLGGSASSQTLQDALAYAYGKGVTIVAASGNDGKGVVSYPAAYDAYVIAVGATKYDNARAYYSNYGTSLDLVAPGGQTCASSSWYCTTNDQNHDGYGDGILQQTFSGAYNNFGYYLYQGTSMATPHVAAVAALVVSEGVSDPVAVRQALESTATDLGVTGRDNVYGYGLVNASAALAYAGGVGPPPPPPSNVAPVAFAQSVVTDQNVPLGITLTGSDADGDPLAYTVVSVPSHGTLTGAAPSLTYTPSAGYSGPDSFTFKIYDGQAYSNTATVSITVNPLSPPPSAQTANISISLTALGGSRWRTRAVVTVKVGSATLSNATVQGFWSGATNGPVSVTTSGSGTASFYSSYVVGNGTVTLTVTGVSKGGTTYSLSGETSDSVSH